MKIGCGIPRLVNETEAGLSFSGRDCEIVLSENVNVVSVTLKSSEESLDRSGAVEAREIGVLVLLPLSKVGGVVLSLSGTVNTRDSERLELLVVP